MKTSRIREPQQGWTQLVVPALGAIALVLVVWGPLIWNGAGTSLDDGDPLYEAWNLNWVQHSVASPDSLFSANMFHPTSDSLALSDTRIGPALVVAPLHLLGVDPLGMVTAALMIGVVLNFLSAWILGKTLTGSARAAWVTGAMYAFGPLPMLFMYHLHMTWRAGLPLAIACIWRSADQGKVDRWSGIGLVFASLLAVTASVYQVAFLGLVVLATGVVRWRDLRGLQCVRGVGLLILGALPGIPIMLAHLRIASSGVAHFDLSAVAVLSAYPFRVDWHVLLWRGRLGPRTVAERFLMPTFVGAGAYLFGVGGAWVQRRRHGRAVALGLVLVAVGVVLGIGAAPTGWKRFTPMRVLFELPLYNAVRGAGRYWAIALIGFAVLAGLLAEWLSSRFMERFATPRIGWFIAAIGVVVPMVEGWPDLTDLPRTQISALDRSLTDRTGAVAYLPLNVAEDSIDFIPKSQIRALYRSTAHHRPIVNGYSGSFPKTYLEISNQLKTIPSPESIRTLQDLGVTDVVVTVDALGTPWQSLLDPQLAAPLEFVTVVDGEVRYHVPAP